MIEYVLLFAGKIFGYYLVCTKAPSLLAIAPADRLTFAAAWAGLRLVLGLLATYPIIVGLGLANDLGLPPVVMYALVLLAVRSTLWWLVAKLILQRHRSAATPRVRDWVFLGVCASFAIDALAWISGASFKFFC